MANKMKREYMWAVWNDDIGFYVDTRLSREEMIEKHTSDLGMTWDECKKAGDKVIRVEIKAAQPRVHLTESPIRVLGSACPQCGGCEWQCAECSGALGR